MGKGFKRYSEVIRSTLIWNGIIPIMGVAIGSFLILFIIGTRLIINENVKINKSIAADVNGNILEYSDFINRLSQDELLINIIEKRSKPSNAYEILYKFINKRSIKSNF